ncbi:uncharacterized protein RHOBADRAFT_14034 [Rhodotorula graminis WP1]|uniref:GST C-terminal domain-containing protein n=1 Tax=Rhodotorula graminis (strain WP1) TaxID=578459 RepID=A0A194S5X8_RHOGW|nr:uncharacterized protein RHOBADRAFT_14034 [Rhodotorula graminis WP1]KPV75944.1 hypothetical protein RHOBADRAFT_14034 [Rhodotorula graminis WP1]
MATDSAKYTLIYHAGIPGRGEFPRLFLEATATPYEDTALTVGQDAVKPFLDGSFDGSDANPLPFAPPVLKHGSVVISQTSNILLYLATHASALSVDDPALFHAQELALTVLDLNNEIHDTHHPIAVSAYYEEFKDEAIKRAGDFRKNRLPKFFKHFEDNLQRSSSDYLLSSGPSHADLCLFQVYDGLLFAFPRLMAKTLPEYPKVRNLYERVKAAPRIKAYLESDRRQKYSMGIFRHYPELDEPEEK